MSEDNGCKEDPLIQRILAASVLMISLFLLFCFPTVFEALRKLDWSAVAKGGEINRFSGINQAWIK